MFEPIPSMPAPMLTSIRARSWTCGSQAALPITVMPGVRAAASSAFSVAITDGSSMNTSPARSPPGARSSMSRACSNVAPSAANASRCGSRRRRPMTSPPGGGIRTRPKRASSGPASRNDARMRSDRRRSMTASSAETSAAHSATSCSESHLIRTPSASRIASIAPTSLIFGTLRTTTSSSVRTEAARIGRAPFLLPAGTIVPDSAVPPSMTNFSMSECLPATGAGPEGWARVTAMPARISRDEAWSLLSEWVHSESLRRHCLAVEAAMVAFAERGGHDAELWGVDGAAARRRLRALPGHGRCRARAPTHDHGRARAPRRPARDGPGDRRACRLPRRAPRIRARPHARRRRRAVRVPRRLRVRAPGGHPRADAQVGQEEAQAAIVRGRRQPRRRPSWRGAARRRVRRARQRSSSPRSRRGPTSSSCTGAMAVARRRRRSGVSGSRPRGPCRISCSA